MQQVEHSLNFSVMIIEDDSFMLQALSTILQEEGYKTIMAENGVVALEKLKTIPTPDLILLDMIMPEMDGWDFANIYQKNFTSHTPIIVVSGAADVGKRAEDIKAEAWIPKPYNLDDILKLIRNFYLRKLS